MNGEESSLRPQSLLLTFLGDQVLGRDVCVYSGSIIDVFERAGVGEQATRSTLTRMVKRDLLRRQREGRRMYFGLTEHSTAVLRDGEHRIWQTGAVNRDWDGTWTLLGFSLCTPVKPPSGAFYAGARNHVNRVVPQPLHLEARSRAGPTCGRN